MQHYLIGISYPIINYPINGCAILRIKYTVSFIKLTRSFQKQFKTEMIKAEMFVTMPDVASNLKMV